jgi:hypothetical protein
MYTPDQEQRIKKAFPFGEPPLDFLEDLYIVIDQSLRMDEGYHQANSSMLALAQENEQACSLVPSAAFGKGWHSLDLRTVRNNGMPRILEMSKWALWIGSNALRRPVTTAPYTPERADTLLETIRSFKRHIETRPINRTQLRSIVENPIPNGLGLQYVFADWYADDLPDALERQEASAQEQAERLFASAEEDINKMAMIYHGLSPESRLLLDTPFNLTFGIKMEGRYPFYHAGATSQVLAKYLSEMKAGEISQELAKYLSATKRDPRQFAAETRGVKQERISCIGIQDNIDLTTDIGKIAIQHLKAMGIKSEVTHEANLHATSCERCSQRYETDAGTKIFTLGDVCAAVVDGRLIPFLEYTGSLD